MTNPRLVNLVGALGLTLADGQQRAVTAATGLASSEAAALNFVGQTPGCSIEAARTALAITHPGTVRVIDRLAGRRLIERRAGVDGRTRGLWLTPSGTEVWVRLNEARLTWIEAALDRLDRTEQAQLESAVEVLLAALTRGYDESEHMCRLCDLRVCPQDRCPITLALGRCRSVGEEALGDVDEGFADAPVGVS